ncbi:uncharacterized membrane protein YtjA (UPF0391 family) [Ancylobacter sp. 3268]|uniref:DUF1328 domain-containing protein n=1 Tax=Ancylobacter sp. 3268 TaxID=2817752 RepID=UPI0028566386|nr:DUF1328 domain-containing protein [Ancylobacter sp. 3268]MDR6954695.1 uncharacterized membrane protein YtjA (UPF0391 family) [Ancylobacter sp. 3268]
MFKYAVIFLVISLIAGGIGLTGISALARRISFILFGLFFLGFLALIGLALLVDKAMTTPSPV